MPLEQDVFLSQLEQICQKSYKHIQAFIIVQQHDNYFNTNNALKEFLESEKFTHIPYEAKRAVASSAWVFKPCFAWLCENGNGEDFANLAATVNFAQDMQLIINNPAFAESDIPDFYNLLSSHAKEMFLKMIPESMKTIEILIEMVNKTSASPQLMAELRNVTQMDETFPDEWVLKVAGGTP